ncbi:MAG: hypothetical protein BWY99_01800 [Synergistetes bacterium ADurb.BinA166]|nr:MAG: hypothetical protein BWY99_01800 [Synergistetes bacterium ADurb.BinA166]
MESFNKLAQDGYEAYGAAAEWKAWDGKPMPTWDELRPDIVMKWEAAARAMAAHVIQARQGMPCGVCGVSPRQDAPIGHPNSPGGIIGMK